MPETEFRKALEITHLASARRQNRKVGTLGLCLRKNGHAGRMTVLSRLSLWPQREITPAGACFSSLKGRALRDSACAR